MSQCSKSYTWKLLLGVVLPLLFSFSVAAQSLMTVRTEEQHDVSRPLRDMIQAAPKQALVMHEAEPVRRIPLPAGLAALPDDPVRQRTAASIAAFAPVVGLGFEGLGNGQYKFNVSGAPPDTNGAVGATQYVQWVNTSFAVFNKSTGALISGPTAGNTLWSGFGGGCQDNNDGDPIVLYDKLANRWVFSQFSVSTTPYLQCIAVSTSSDATGTYNRYSFQYNNFDDYPKMGVWPDGYYETFNMFNGNNFVGSDACAYNRTAMLNGATATQVCFQQNSSVGGLLPSDLDGTTAPPAGSPNYMLFYGKNNLNLFKFHADFATSTNSTFTGPTVIPVAAFLPLCNNNTGTCVPQPGTTSQLDSLDDRLMYRLAYRNLGTHESLVVNHSVATSSSGGVRWYEIQNPSGSPVLAQQGTFAPDSNYRWMGSIAMDQVGDIAVGYSISSSSVFPSVAFTGRVPTDPAGTMQAETRVVSGSGSQTSQTRTLTRWGDYSAMQVDPVDDCTFWYTQEYIKTNGVFNWNTRIASFKFPNCSTNTFLLNVTLAGNGTVTSSPAGISCPSINCSANFASGTTVTLTATAAAGATFAGWSGAACSGTGTCSINMTAAQSVTATFNLVTFPLSVTSAGSGSGSITSNPSGISCPTSTCSASFTSGTTVTLTATPATGSTFAGWSGAACSGTGTCSVNMTAAQSVTATFNLVTFPLSVTSAGSGSGSITSNPSGISCPTSTCSASFTSGTTVTLTATPAAGSTFAGWSGAACPGTGACSLSMTANQLVTATFQVANISTTTKLAVSSTQAIAGSAVTFTARVSPTSGSTTPTGSVTFKNGSTILGVVPLSNGVASLTTSSLGPGPYTVTASYSGDTNSGSSTSAPVALTVVDYTVTPSALSLTVKRGQSGQVTLAVTPAPAGSFSPTVTFACSGLPLQATCSFSPATVTTSGALANTTLTIQTTASARLEHLFGRSELLYAFLLPGFMGIVLMRRNGKRIAGSARLLGLICLLTLSTIWSTGCGAGASPPGGGGSTPTVGTPLGSSVVTITATATSSGTPPITKQVTVTLTVQ